MKKSSRLLGVFALAAVLAFSLAACFHVTDKSGAGTSADPHLISNAGQLKKLADEVNAGDNKSGEYYKLADNIDLLAYRAGWTPIGRNEDTPFSGNFDGAGFVISNLFIDDSNQNNSVGLFGDIVGGKVANLGVEIAASGSYSVGGVAGYVEGGAISNCYVSGSIEGIASVGGVTGYLESGEISNCYFTGSVAGLAVVGGVTGAVVDGSVSNSYATGVLAGIAFVGGVAGAIYDSGSIIKNCASLFYSIVDATDSLGLGLDLDLSGGIGRVVGYNDAGTLQNNVAYAAMTLPPGATPTNNLDDVDGGNITLAQLNNRTTYETGLGWKFGSNANNPWAWNSILGLPVLHMQP